MRILDLSVYGVHPARSAGHLAILEPLRYLAQQGHEVDILSLGLRSFEKRFPRRFQVEIAPRLRETRLVSALSLLKAQLFGKTRFPPLTAAGAFAERSRPQDTALVARADLVILESPWAFTFARTATRAPILWIAHNQEARLHQEVLREAGLLERAREIEGECYREVDLVLPLHEADAKGLREDYGNRTLPLEILPLGCDIHPRTDPARRLAARESWGLHADARVALFAGSAHAPNVRAADRLEALAPDLAAAGWEILIAGSVRSAPRTFVGGRSTGPLADLTSCYEACDLAVNPVEEGSGMNVKNLHAMARGLPVLCSPVGARGFTSGEETGLLEVDTGDLVTRLRELTARPESVEALSIAAHETAQARYSWPAIVEARLAFMAAHLPTGSTSG